MEEAGEGGMGGGGEGGRGSLKDCSRIAGTKGNGLGWAKNTAQRVNTIKDYTRGR